ncbi:DUF4440 domain-containing protein [Candidatus Entotheonella serta]|nr:DUF4440 domain-containing protein [Candidatus Entotheonella serta]
METDPPLAEHLRDLEERLFQPDVRQSAVAVAELLADGCVEFGSSGRVYSRESILEALRHEAPAQRSLTDFKTLVLAPDVVLVTYRAVCQLGHEASPITSLRSSIWQRIDGRWQMRFHQGTVA